MADIMSKNPTTVTREARLTDAGSMMAEKNIGAVVVVGPQGEVLGIVTEGDLAFKIVARGKNPREVTVSEVMTPDPKCLTPETSIVEAFNLIQEGRFRHVPIVEEGRLKGIVSVRDINRGFYAEKELVHELKSKFLMVTSHELRTPYAIIRGYVELLLDQLKGDRSELENDALHGITESVKRVERILDELTKYYMTSSPIKKKRFSPTQIEKIVRDTVEEIKVFIEKRSQSIRLEIEKDLPKVLVSAGEIKHVLFNLLMNAIRFTRDGGILQVRVKNQSDHIRVEVEDNGIGIPQEKLSLVFESFYEIQDENQHSSGTIEFRSGGMGLGLAIAKKIIESHEGRIWAESAEGEFARFIFTIPKKRISIHKSLPAAGIH